MAYVVSFVFCLLELSARAFEAENRRGHGEGLEEKNSLSFDRQKKNGDERGATARRRCNRENKRLSISSPCLATAPLRSPLDRPFRMLSSLTLFSSLLYLKKKTKK